jgi:anti-sigma regulatory factor (Ser/Thr protein kinase)
MDEHRPDEHRLVETFEPSTTEVGRARHLVRSQMEGWGMETDAPEVELIVSELVSNAVVHGQGRICLCLRQSDDHVEVDVRDEGRGHRPHLRASSGIGGWGLRIVNRLADRWGTRTDATGTSVWATKPVFGYHPTGC